MVEGVSKTFDTAIKDFLVEAQAYKEDLEGLFDQAVETHGADSEQAVALSDAIELVETALDAVEALPG